MVVQEEPVWMHVLNSSGHFIYVVPLLVLMFVWDLQRKHALATGCLASAWLIMHFLYLEGLVYWSVSLPLPSVYELQKSVSEPLIYSSTGLLIGTLGRFGLRYVQGPIPFRQMPIRCSGWLISTVLISVIDVMGCMLLYLWLLTF